MSPRSRVEFRSLRLSPGRRRHRVRDELQHRERSRVTLADADLGDTGAATIASLQSGCDLIEKLRHHVFVSNRPQHQPPGVQIAALCLGDEFLGQRLDTARLGLGGGDAAVLEELSGQVAQDEALMVGATAQTGPLGRLRHFSNSFGLVPSSARCVFSVLLGLGVVFVSLSVDVFLALMFLVVAFDRLDRVEARSGIAQGEA